LLVGIRICFYISILESSWSQTNFLAGLIISLKLPLHLESFLSKRIKVIKRGTHTSTYRTCDHTSMSTESSQKDIGSPSTPIPSIVNGTPSMPSTTAVVVLEVPFITPILPIVATHPIVTNPFGSLFSTPGYNVESIPLVSNPFSFGM
jgi:hypothetical protein